MGQPHSKEQARLLELEDMYDHAQRLLDSTRKQTVEEQAAGIPATPRRCMPLPASIGGWLTTRPVRSGTTYVSAASCTPLDTLRMHHTLRLRLAGTASLLALSAAGVLSGLCPPQPVLAVRVPCR